MRGVTAPVDAVMENMIPGAPAADLLCAIIVPCDGQDTSTCESGSEKSFLLFRPFDCETYPSTPVVVVSKYTADLPSGDTAISSIPSGKNCTWVAACVEVVVDGFGKPI